MEARAHIQRLGDPAKPRTLRKPMTGCNVWPMQRCPAFTVRTVGLGCGSGCWFCRYANFHLRKQVPLDVGICCWPRAQSD